MIVIVGVWRFSGIIQTHKIIDVDRQHISSNAERQEVVEGFADSELSANLADLYCGDIYANC